MKKPHTRAPRGKRIRVALRDGRVLTGKFIENTNKFVRFWVYFIAIRDIKSLTIMR